MSQPPSPDLAPRKPLLSLDDALERLLATVTPLAEHDAVDTFAADGRVLACDLNSELHVPALDNSAMDGYAVYCADVHIDGSGLPVSQRIAAGSEAASQQRPLQRGTVARIFTGAPIPPGADAVVPQEETRLDASEQQLSFIANVTPGQWIRRAGEDVRRGETVLRAGQRLGPAELGLAASIGFAELPVLRRPRVALFSTGDELVMPGAVAPQAMRPGAIYNSNRFFLRALLQRLGCVVSDLGIVPDQRQATLDALAEAARGHDVIVTSGGVSVGEEDHIKPAVQTLGTLDLWQLAIKPGKPFAHGRIGASHFVGLPGNPVSSFVTFLLLVRPLLLRLQGVAEVSPQAQAMPAHFDWPKPDRRREFLRVRRNAQGGLDLFPNQSSGVLTSAVWADGVVDVPAGTTITHNQMVRFIPFAGWV